MNPVETLNPVENRWDDRDEKGTITTTPSGTNPPLPSTTPSITPSSSTTTVTTTTTTTTTSIATSPPSVITDQPRSSTDQLPDVTRKSSRAKRVKSYLKRCKQAALGGGGGGGGGPQVKPQVAAEDPVVYHDLPDKIVMTQFRSRSLSRRRGQEVLCSTYWYVDDELEEDNVEKYQSATTQTEADTNDIEVDGQEVVDSRTEGGTVIIELDNGDEDEKNNKKTDEENQKEEKWEEAQEAPVTLPVQVSHLNYKLI